MGVVWCWVKHGTSSTPLVTGLQQLHARSLWELARWRSLAMKVPRVLLAMEVPRVRRRCRCDDGSQKGWGWNGLPFPLIYCPPFLYCMGVWSDKINQRSVPHFRKGLKFDKWVESTTVQSLHGMWCDNTQRGRGPPNWREVMLDSDLSKCRCAAVQSNPSIAPSRLQVWWIEVVLPVLGKRF